MGKMLRRVAALCLALVLAYPAGFSLGVRAWNETTAPVTNIILEQNIFTVSPVPVQLNDFVTVEPANFVGAIEWELRPNAPPPAVPASQMTLEDGELTVLQPGNVQLRATIEGGGANGQDFVRHFIVSFTAATIQVSLTGLSNISQGNPVNGSVVFTITGDMPTTPPSPWEFAEPIVFQDFFVASLPPGLVAGNAVRISNSVVSIPITGTPETAILTTWNLTLPPFIPGRNVRLAGFNVPVLNFADIVIGPVSASAILSDDEIVFDLNPASEQHRDILLAVTPRGNVIQNVRFGQVQLERGTDFFVFGNGVLMSRTFMSRMITGRWNIVVEMSGAAANPTFQIIVIDSRIGPAFPPNVAPVDPGPHPTPPPTPHHPDATFIHLSGGRFVDIMNLNFARNRARVAPAVVRGEATTTIRANVFEEMAVRIPYQRIEIATSLTRLFIPTDFLDIIHGAREAIEDSPFNTSLVDVRIRLIDVSSNESYAKRFETQFPGGILLSRLSELRVELVNVITNEVLFTAVEFTRPLEMIHAVLQPGAHLRPAGKFFHDSRIEFVPFRTFSPNEVSVITRFTGVHGVVQNATHFSDVHLNHFAFQQAFTAAYSGLVTARDQLHVMAPITRAEFAQLLAYALQLPREGITSSGFADVPNSHPMFDGISRLNATGLLWPWSGNNFLPNAIITREEMAAIVAGAIVIGNPVREPMVRPLNTTFTDGNSFSTHLIPAVQLTVNYNLMIGYPDGSFRPHTPAVRIYALQVIVAAARLLGFLD